MKILLLLSVLIATNGIAQKKTKIKVQDTTIIILSEKDKIPYYSEVVTADSVKKDDLFLRAKKWFVDYYKSAKDVIQLEDKENGEIIGKGVFVAKVGFITNDIYHTVKIYLKDNKYKYEITNLTGKQHIPGGVGLLGSTAPRTEDLEISNHYIAKSSQRSYQTLLKMIHANIMITIESLKAYMNSSKKDF